MICIYCIYTEQTVQTVENLISSLLKQLAQDCSVISDTVESLYKRHVERNTRPTFEEYTRALQSEIKTFSRVFVVVDALDECLEDNRSDLLTALRSLGNTVNLMVTSRDLSSIAKYFPRTKRLDIYATNEDVQRYIEGRITRTSRQHLKSLQEIIVNKIVENVKGM